MKREYFRVLSDFFYVCLALQLPYLYIQFIPLFVFPEVWPIFRLQPPICSDLNSDLSFTVLPLTTSVSTFRPSLRPCHDTHSDSPIRSPIDTPARTPNRTTIRTPIRTTIDTPVRAPICKLVGTSGVICARARLNWRWRWRSFRADVKVQIGSVFLSDSERNDRIPILKKPNKFNNRNTFGTKNRWNNF